MECEFNSVTEKVSTLFFIEHHGLEYGQASLTTLKKRVVTFESYTIGG